MKFAHFLFFFLFATSLVFAQDKIVINKPDIEGVIRAKYEYNTSISAHRFEVRNARFSVNGKFSPLVYYKAEIDLSDEGVTKMLDAYLRFTPGKRWTFTIGQQKVPFSTDNLRSPNQLYFANRSFIGKQLTGLRDVGATLELKNFSKIPLSVQFGAYNGTGLYNQKVWRKTNELSYITRLVVNPSKNLSFSADVNSIKPTDLRMNLFNAGVMWDLSNLHLESEYFYKTYHADLYAPTHGFFAFAAYNIKTENNKYFLRKITPLVRYDLMTKNERFSDTSTLVVDVARSRITGGLTFSFDKPFINDIRLNYEQYFYASGVANADNKLVIEYVLRF